MPAINPLLLVNNLHDKAVLTGVPAMLATMPIENTQLQPRKKTTIAAALGAQEFKGTFGAVNQSVNMVALRYHNLTAGATVRVRLFSDPNWTTNIYDNTFNAFAYTGLDASVNIADADFKLFKNSSSYFATFNNVQSYIITVTDAGNTLPTEVSRLFLGKYSQFTLMFQDGGAPFITDTLTKSGTVLDGGVASDRRENFVRCDLRHDQCRIATDWAMLCAAFHRLGKHQDFWFSLYPQDGTFAEVYGQNAFKFIDASGWDRNMYGHFATRLSLRSM